MTVRNFADVRVLSVYNLSLRQSVRAPWDGGRPQEGGLEENLVVCYFEGRGTRLLLANSTPHFLERTLGHQLLGVFEGGTGTLYSDVQA